jgi:hypothetical protein
MVLGLTLLGNFRAEELQLNEHQNPGTDACPSVGRVRMDDSLIVKKGGPFVTDDGSDHRRKQRDWARSG